MARQFGTKTKGRNPLKFQITDSISSPGQQCLTCKKWWPEESFTKPHKSCKQCLAAKDRANRKRVKTETLSQLYPSATETEIAIVANSTSFKVGDDIVNALFCVLRQHYYTEFMIADCCGMLHFRKLTQTTVEIARVHHVEKWQGLAEILLHKVDQQLAFHNTKEVNCTVYLYGKAEEFAKVNLTTIKTLADAYSIKLCRITLRNHAIVPPQRL